MTTPKTVSDFAVVHLKTWEMQRLFGYFGEGINGTLSALNHDGNDSEFLRVRPWGDGRGSRPVSTPSPQVRWE